MKMTFRWYGESDPVTLSHIRQIPGVTGIVTALYDVPVGEVWPLDKILALKKTVEDAGLKLSVIERVPVHEDIKMGLPSRDRLIANYCETIKSLGKAGIDCVCYNFMPVFDWTRSDLNYPNEDGSNSLAYITESIRAIDPEKGTLSLPGWDSSYKKDELKRLLEFYRHMTEEELWENLTYFLKPVIDAAEAAKVKMAIHPDDPPWSIFSIPRIITSKKNLERFLSICPSVYNGLTLCSGSLGASRENDIVDMVHSFANRIHFAHIRNIRWQGEDGFIETAHRTDAGSLDIYGIAKAYIDEGADIYVRPDHGRMIWGEEGRPGYGLYDRALGAVYLNGLFEAIEKGKNNA